VVLTAIAPALLALLIGPFAPPARAAGGAIRGRVEVRRDHGAPDPRPAPTALGLPQGRHRSGPDRQLSVVYLEEAPQSAFPEPAPGRATLDQRHQAFVPYVLAISAGTSVDFPNNDRTYHNVFSYSKAERFDLGRYGKGHSKSVRFDRPGVVRVFCDIHSHMSAFILVFAHRYFAATGTDGSYRISDVPAGTYNLAVWNDGQVREVRSVTVPAGGDVEADFVVK
jgi:plastocyanin